MQGFFENQICEDNKSYVKSICGIPHSFGLGGVHGALSGYHEDSGKLLHIDATSYYPTIANKNDLLTRAAKLPDRYKQILETRMRLKAEGKKEEQVPYKLVLNAAIGASGDPYSPAYDPKRHHEVSINGELFMVMLLERLEGNCKLVQTNTDGIIVSYDGYDYDTIIHICEEWGRETGIELCFRRINEIWPIAHMLRKGCISSIIQRSTIMWPLSAKRCAKA